MTRFLWLLLFPIFVSAQLRLSDAARVSILTCGTGGELYSLFGHTAIRIEDENAGLDIVYNYGAFDFSVPNFVGRFVKGDLQYFVATDSFSGFLEQYRYEGRQVVEQELFLTKDQKQKLFDELARVLYSDDRFYTYKFIDRNCTNMAMAVVNKILGAQVLKKAGDTSITYREIIYPYFDNHFFEQWGTSLIFGTKVDQPSTTLFLPSELEKSLETATFQGKPLSEKSRLILPGPTPEKQSRVFPWLIYLSILAAVAFVRMRWVIAAYFSAIGLVGVFFCIAGSYSLHAELQYNYNVLLCNPLLLGVAWGVVRKTEWVKKLAWVCLALLVIYLPFVALKVHFLIALPMILAHAFVLWKIAKGRYCPR